MGGVPDSRVGAWTYATKYIAEHPIIGHGTYYSIEKGLEARWWPHNLYLYYASIVGILGLSCFLWFLWGCGRSAHRERRRSAAVRTCGRAAVFRKGGDVTFLVDEMKIEYLRNERYSFVIWFFFGLVVAVSTAAKNEWTLAGRANADAEPDAPRRPTPQRVAVAGRAAVSGGR